MDETLTLGWEQLSVRRPTINNCSLSNASSTLSSWVHSNHPPPLPFSFFEGAMLIGPSSKNLGTLCTPHASHLGLKFLYHEDFIFYANPLLNIKLSPI
jgi:hypothetical protein